MDTIQLDKPDLPRAADVVFIIQHAPCNLELMSKLPVLVENLDNALRAQNLRSVRYAVVGFGGRQLHLAQPQIRTMDGQVFNSANKVGKFYVAVCKSVSSYSVGTLSTIINQFLIGN